MTLSSRPTSGACRFGPMVRAARFVSWESWIRSVREQVRLERVRKVNQWKARDVMGVM